MTNMVGSYLLLTTNHWECGKKFWDEFEIEGKETLTWDFEPLLWYEKEANDTILNKVWQTPDKRGLIKDYSNLGLSFMPSQKTYQS